MKKTVILLMVCLSCLCLFGCEGNATKDIETKEVNQLGSSEEDLKDPANWYINSDSKATSIIKQTAVNECCEYSKTEKLALFEIGAQERIGLYSSGTAEYKITGSYYPKDIYGDMGDKHYFSMTIEVDCIEGNAWVVDSEINKYK